LLYALEIFVSRSKRSHFFTFPQPKVRNVVARCIVENIKILNVSSPVEWIEAPSRAFKYSNWTHKWKHREISNFEYLMRLNTYAGRSYQDISQYPVMPWILTAYNSDTINLADPSVYRDLSKPIGALNPQRLQLFLDRYREMERDPDKTIPSFLYGSHYSNLGSVLFWLIRLEPFSGIGREIQGGEFDVADRLFSSVASAWQNCLTGSADVKELTPGFSLSLYIYIYINTIIIYFYFLPSISYMAYTI